MAAVSPGAADPSDRLEPGQKRPTVGIHIRVHRLDPQLLWWSEGADVLAAGAATVAGDGAVFLNADNGRMQAQGGLLDQRAKTGGQDCSFGVGLVRATNLTSQRRRDCKRGNIFGRNREHSAVSAGTNRSVRERPPCRSA